MVNSTKEFDMINNERVPSSYQMISFDVSSLLSIYYGTIILHD